MENNISVRIYIKDGKLKHIVPEFPWEGQINAQVIYHDIEFDKLDGDFCREFACPEGPELHKHEGFGTAVIRAESMQSDPIHTHEYEQKPDGSRRMDASCGAYVCLDCGDHQGLARCYCGWASDGGDGVAQLRAKGENVEDDY
jgi:hypothetical protein